MDEKFYLSLEFVIRHTAQAQHYLHYECVLP